MSNAGCRWNSWNLDHATRHGVTVAEIESIVCGGKREEHVGEGKYRIAGRGTGDRWIQAIYFYDPEQTVYVIHARPLNEREKRRERRSSR